MGEIIAQLFFTGIMLGICYGLIALGLHLIFNATGLISFAHGELVVWGSLLLYTFWIELGFPLGLALLLIIVCGGLMGLVMERICVYLTAGMPPMVPMLAILFAGIALQAIALISWGTDIKGISYFVTGPPVKLLGAAITRQYFCIAGIAGIVLLFVNGFFKWTMWGRTMVANADNPEGAKVIGIDASRVSLFIFTLSGALGALAGGLIGPITGARPELGMTFTLKGFAASIIGGLNSTAGVVVGGILIGLLEAFIGGLISSQFRDIAIFALIIVGLMVRPWGLLGHEESERKHF